MVAAFIVRFFAKLAKTSPMRTQLDNFNAQLLLLLPVSSGSISLT